MRLAVATTGYPRFEGDVAGTFVEGMVDALRERGHSVSVFAPDFSPGGFLQNLPPLRRSRASRSGQVLGTLAESLPAEDSETSTAHDVHWVRYLPRRMQHTFYGEGAPDNLRHPRAWLGAMTFPLALRHALRGRFDALISHFGVPCGLVGATLPIPQLVVWHSADVHLARKMPRSLRRALFARSKHWFVHDEHRRALELEGVVAPMGATVRAFHPRETRERWNIRGKTVLFVGRLVPVKGVDVLVEAARGASWSAIVAGPGTANTPANVRCVGAVTPRERDSLLAACDALAIPSRRLASGRTEGSPVIAQEGLLAGIPIVASRVGGLGALDVTHVEPEDPAALRRALDIAVQTPRKHRGGSTWPAIAARVDEELRSLLR